MGVRTSMTAAWPPFGLRIRTARLVLRLPADDDLIPLMELARAGIHEPGTMPFGSAWSTVPSPLFERGFLQHHWAARGTWSPDRWFLHLMVEHDGQPIGSQSVDAVEFATTRTVHTGSWLGRASQGRGFGKEMREAVLAFAFDGLGARLATTEAFLDNGPSNGVSRSLGYEPAGSGSLAPEGVARETQKFQMTVDGWRARPRSQVTIEGLDGCREMFGA